MNQSLTCVCLAAALMAGCAKKREERPEPTQPTQPQATKPPVAISILYGSEKKQWLEEQLSLFNASATHTSDGRAITATGKPMGSGEAMGRIVDGTERPTVYSPASSAYVTLLDDAWRRHGNDRPITRTGEPLVLSPIVIAMWQPMAELLGWPHQSIGWSDILRVSRDPRGWAAIGRPEWGAMKLGHTHPELSSSGLLSMLAIAYAGAGTTRNLTAADIAKAEPFMAQVEDAVVHYGTSTGFFADKMVERGPSYLSAAVMYENLVIESRSSTKGTGAMPLVAIYPVEGTFWSDHPFSILDAPWVGPAEREAAGKLLAFLKAQRAQTRALELGFRPADAALAIQAPVDAAHGVDAKQPQTLLEMPGAATLDALVAAWKRTKKTADVVFVFDKSGSMMGQPLEQAKRGALAFLDALDPRDRVTLLFFDHDVYTPYGPVEVGAARTELAARIAGVSASGETAVYEATHQAVQLLAQRRDAAQHRIRAAVVMTDGGDNRSHITLAQLRAEVSGERRAATVFTIGYGPHVLRAPLEELARDGGGSFSEGDVRSILGVYRDLASFF
jgi:Ca-activated chloride channel family protein